MRPLPSLLVTTCVVAAAGCTIVVPPAVVNGAGAPIAAASAPVPSASPSAGLIGVPGTMVIDQQPLPSAEPKPAGSAVPKKPGPRPLPSSTPLQCGLDFDARDADRDGQLSPSEWGLYDGREITAAKAEFDLVDGDDSGAVDINEWCARTNDPSPTPPPEPTCRELLLSKDGNGDGLLGWEEFYAYQTEVELRPDRKDDLYAEWQRLDLNQSGGVEPAEYCADERPASPSPDPTPGCRFDFAVVDANGDGEVTYEEYERSVPPSTGNKGAALRRLDEIGAAFTAWDGDGNRRLVRGEVCVE